MNKDIQWLRETVARKAKTYQLADDKYKRGSFDSYDDVLFLIDRLDEPTMTEEQAWEVIHGKYGEETLQNNIAYLEAKGYEVMEPETDDSQVVVEKPVIPKEVAEHIEEQRTVEEASDDFIIYNAISEADTYMVHVNDFPENLIKYIKGRNGALNFAKAVIAGYEVEEEQKYYIHLIEDSEVDYLNKDLDDGNLLVLSKDEDEIHQTKFTEEEIKEMNPSYWGFAVRVEEVDNA